MNFIFVFYLFGWVFLIATFWCVRVYVCVLTVKWELLIKSGGKKNIQEKKKRKKKTHQTKTFFMNTKHIPSFSFPKTAETVFVMTISEEIWGFSAIPKILDWKSHIIHTLRLIWALWWFPEMVCSSSTNNRYWTKYPSDTVSTIFNLIKTLVDCIYKQQWLDFLEEKNVPFKNEWYFSHQPYY